MKMDSKQARRVLQEAGTRLRRMEELQFERLLFGPQRKFVEDESKLKAAVCSRRAGKSYGISLLALKTAMQYSDALVPVITLTRQQAKRIVWPVFQSLNRTIGLGLRFNHNELTATLPNGSQIFLCGANDESEIERLRGPKYPLVIIDEAQSFRPFLAQMIADIIEPAVLDYDGTITLTGTPNATCTGYFYEATRPDSGWSVHNWTLLDNPHLPKAAQWLAERRTKYGWKEDTPTYLREYKGVWIKDLDSLVYKHVPVIEEFDPGDDEWFTVMGVDIGYVDSSAFCILAYSESQGRCVVLESFKKASLIPSEVAELIAEAQEEYGLDVVVVDTGGIGKGYVEEARKRFGLSLVEAEKTKKRAYIELLNGDLARGIVEVSRERNRDLLEEISILQWDEQRKLPDKRRYDDHVCDALLYAWRYCHQYLMEHIEEGPEKGSEQWFREQEDEMEEIEIKRLEKDLDQKFYDLEESETPWWERDEMAAQVEPT